MMLLAFSYQHSIQAQYISKVHKFVPAPGQFVNDIPTYESGDSEKDMAKKAEALIANNKRGLVSLGAYGGYIIFSFDQPVENKEGYYDFRILGNAFNSTNANSPGEGGSSEPGIVMVAYDSTGNGEPDDGKWYELAGSEHDKSGTTKGYEITYYKPDENKEKTPDPSEKYLNDMTYIRWTDNQGGQGYVARNTFHNQPYYPQWIAEETLTFKGTRLANNGVDESGTGRYYVLYAYHWGYADNVLNTDDRSCFDISWAIDANGDKVNLEKINLVKVYTGVNQYCGWIGETSTEIMGAENLHALNRKIEVPSFTTGVSLDRQTARLDADKGETLILTPTVYPANASEKSVSWASSNKTVATVDNQGKITAIAAGNTTITVVTNDGYYLTTCQVQVSGSTSGSSDGQVTGVLLDPETMTLSSGEVAALTATILPADAEDKSVRWTSSAPEIAEVTVSGNIFAYTPGQTTITVTTVDGNHTATCLVTVTEPGATADEQIETTQPTLYYKDQTLWVSGLEGYDCAVIHINGQIVSTFRIQSSAYSHSLPLPSGIYILSAQKQTERKTFKWRIP